MDGSWASRYAEEKIALMTKLAMGYDVTHLQVTQMSHFCNHFKSTHWMISNPHAHDGSGGTVSLYKKITFGSTKPRQRILVKGRVAFALFALDKQSSRSSTFGNIHDFAFTMTDWLKTEKFIAERVEKALCHPMDHFL